MSALASTRIAGGLVVQVGLRWQVHLALLGQPGDPVFPLAVNPDMVVGQAGVSHGGERPIVDPLALQGGCQRLQACR
ncbi:hypothetical protein [Halomonas sp. 141]|uniref:hypothetical protein n=1 Tax=Halomonas sp. 141 TaxID=2056666 RepID=UPI002FCDE14A